MSVYTTAHVSRPSRTDAWLDLFQMLTGAALVLFMWCHMILVSSVLIHPKVMNAIAYFFETTYMAQVGGPLIGAMFLFHFLLAVRKVPFRVEQQGVIWKHARMLRHTDTWLWLVQAITAMIVLIMGAAHMWVVLNDLPITAMKSAARVQQWPWTLFYLVLLPMVELHVSIGFFRIGVKWGFIKRNTRKKYKKFEYVLLAIFLAIGLATLIRFLCFTLSTPTVV